jgi:anti-sigma B factor antagonist
MSTDSTHHPTATLSLHTQTFEDSTVVKCQGILTFENAGHLKREIKDLISRKRPIVLDLSELTRMDSSGLGTIIGLCVSAKAGGCDLSLINLNKQIRELLGLTNLLSVFESCARNGIRMP